MCDITIALQDKENLRYQCGAEEKEIEAVELQMNLRFAEDYREYLKEYGYVSYSGHELTGLGVSDRLNVKIVTDEEKEETFEGKTDMYVIEQTNIDRIVIWQSSDGTIYSTIAGKEFAKLCDSLSEYVKKY